VNLVRDRRAYETIYRVILCPVNEAEDRFGLYQGASPTSENAEEHYEEYTSKQWFYLD